VKSGAEDIYTELYQENYLILQFVNLCKAKKLDKSFHQSLWFLFVILLFSLGIFHKVQSNINSAGGSTAHEGLTVNKNRF